MIPGETAPMEPILKEKAFNSKDYTFQVKWDGVRYLAYIDQKEVILQNKGMKIKTHLYPELAEIFLNVKAANAILDGEIIALSDKGQPSFPLVLKRDLRSTPLQSLTKKVPIYYMVFDILSYQGKDLKGSSFLERQSILLDCIMPSANLQLTDSIREEGLSLFEAVKSQGLEGVVAKKNDSSYRPGKKHKYWFKIKNWQKTTCHVGGILLKNGLLSSLLLGVFVDRELHYVGRVSSGIKEIDKETLIHSLKALQKDKSPFKGYHKSNNNIIWLEPLLRVKVVFLEWTSESKLRSPKIIDYLEPEES